MSYFKAKTHFRLAIRPRPRWGSSQRSPDPLTGLMGSYGPTYKGRGGRRKIKGEGGGCVMAVGEGDGRP